MKNIFLFSTLLLLLFAACSKDQTAVNKLDGSWLVTSKYVNGVPQTLTTTTTYAFVKCNIEQKNECQGSIKVIDGDSTYISVFDYDPSFFSASSQTIDINFDFNNPYFDNQHWDVISFSKKEMTVDYTDTHSSFENVKLTLKKQ